MTPCRNQASPVAREAARYWLGVATGLMLAATAVLTIVVCKGQLAAIPSIGNTLLWLFSNWAMGAAAFGFLTFERGPRQ